MEMQAPAEIPLPPFNPQQSIEVLASSNRPMIRTRRRRLAIDMQVTNQFP